MRLSAIAFFLFPLCAAAAPPYGYEWMEAEPSAQVVQQAGASTAKRTALAWRLSVGYAVRSFEADFHMSAPSIGLITPYLGGLGDVGLYRGGVGFLDYEDGYVGPSNGDGTAGGGAISSNGPDFVVAVGGGVDWRTTDVFRSTGYQMARSAISVSDSSDAWGPYVRLSNALAEDSFGSLGISIAWSSFQGVLASDAVFGHPQRSDFAYRYDRVWFIKPGFNPEPVEAYGFVTDAAKVNALYEQAFGVPGTFRNPRKSVTRSEVPEWTAIGSSFLDVRLNEIFLSADVVWKPWRGWEFGLSAGPTLNVVSTTLNSCTAWERSDGLMVRGESTRQSDTQVAVGGGVQGVVRHDLTRDGRAFIEAHAGYKWLDDIAVGGGSSSANLDLSDWEVGLGVGIRLNDWPAGSPWTVKVGANTRTLSFKAGVADKTALRSLFNRRGGRGDVGLFNGRDTIHYDDGSIEGNGSAPPLISVIQPGGHDTFTINHLSQANLSTRDTLGIPITEGQISFHSSGYQERMNRFDSPEATFEEGVVSPLVEVSRVIASAGAFSVGITWGWVGANESIESDPFVSGRVTTLRTDSTFEYSYPYFRAFEATPNSSSHFPFTNDSLLADPRRFENIFAVDTRHKSQSTTTSLIHYYALTSASVDVSMQTLSLATDLAWKPFARCEVGVSVGPTLNLVHTSTDLSTDWIREDGLLLARLQDHEERTDFKLGLRVMASARYDLTPEGRWFIEARGGYEWMQDIDLGIGLQAATLDATSWQVGGALGCRLGVKARLPEIRDPSLAQQRAKPGPKSQHWLDRLLWKTHSIPVRLGR